MYRLLNWVGDQRDENGFTLIELMVGMLLMGIAMTAIYSSYFSQQKAYVAQAQVAAMQQNLRAAMHMMVSDIRMAGYDKENVGSFGLVSAMPGSYSGSGATCDANNIAFTLDADADRNQDSNDAEMIAYRLNGTDIEKFTTAGGGTWQPIARNIDALDFQYLDGNRVVTTTLGNVRFIEVSVLARTSQVDLDYVNNKTYTNQRNRGLVDPNNPSATFGDNFRRRLLTSFVKCRNLGL